MPARRVVVDGSNIATEGRTTPSLAQLNDDLVAAAEGALPEEIVKACEQVWQDLRGPLPVYNR